MTTPVHSTYGFAPRRRSSNQLSDSALNLKRSLSDISSQTEKSSVAAKESSFKDEEHGLTESALGLEDKASPKTLVSIYTISHTDMNPRKTKKFLPDPPEDSSISDFSEITGRSVVIKTTMDELPGSEASSKLCLSIGKTKRRFRAEPKETPTADLLQRARDLEALQDFAKRVSATVDPSMTLYLERTLYAALQHSWMLGLGGVGIMTVGNDSADAIDLGIMLLSLSLISAVGALVLHYLRLSQIKSGEPFKFWQTALFTSLLTLCVLVTLALEMHYGILYPYLLRTASVKVQNPEVLLRRGHPGNSNL